MLALLVVLAVMAPSRALASDLFAWWQRDFLELRLDPGDWVRMASLEESQEGAHADTLECHVLEGDGAQRWIGIWPSNSDEWWLLRIDVEQLTESRSVEKSLRSLHRVYADGSSSEEDLDELRESQLFRRRLEDPFETPRVAERPLEDGELAGRTLHLREVELSEERERRIPLGRDQAMLYAAHLRSVAQLSPDIPIFGLLRSEMIVEERTERVDGDGERMGPPPELQRTHRTLECLDFGHGEPRGVPEIRG